MRAPAKDDAKPRKSVSIHTIRKYVLSLLGERVLPQNFMILFDSVTVSALERINEGEDASFVIHKTALYLRNKLDENELGLERQLEIARCLKAQEVGQTGEADHMYASDAEVQALVDETIGHDSELIPGEEADPGADLGF